MRRVRVRPTDLLVDALAAYRLTRLVTADVITQPARERAIALAYGPNRPTATQLGGDSDQWQQWVELDEDPPKLATLITCRWCTGVWVAALVVAARRAAPRAWEPAAVALALAAGAALIAGLEQD